MPFKILNEPDVFNASQAEVDKVDIDILVAGYSASGVLSGCAVTAQGIPDMTVAVASGTVIVAGVVADVTGANATIGTADGTNPRFDLITINNAGTIAMTPGAAAANPVFPSIPANSIVLAVIYVPALDTTIATNQITDKRVVVNFGDNSWLTFGDAGDSRIRYDGTDTFWDLQAVGSGALMLALAGSFPSPDGNAVHVWAGNAGTITALSSALLVLEDSGPITLNFLTPNNVVAQIAFGDPEDTDAGRLRYTHATNTLGFYTAGTARLLLSAGALALQGAFTISTTTGDLTLSPSGDVVLPDSTAVALGTGLDSRLYYDGTDTFWDLQAVGTGGLMLALSASFPSPDGVAVHIWDGSAGTVDALSGTVLVLERNGGVTLSLLGRAANVKTIAFGEGGHSSRGWLQYSGSTDTPADTFSFRIANTERLLYSANLFQFQEATAIATTAGDLALNPADDIIIGSDVFIEHDTNAGLTAGTTQTQAGGLALTTEINEIATVATTNDTVVLPVAAAGRQITIINNGANTLQIFPAPGDDLGAGVNTATTLAAAGVVSYVTYNSINWIAF